ncbi:MAG: DUF3800 domain-containing protein [Caldisericum sp.]|nr:DUF3800 domain-containing protein [Caldisericum sp.]
MKKEKDLFENIIERKATYCVFHDESIPNKRWFIIGLLFVQAEYLQKVEQALNYLLEKENYKGEIHFSRLPKKFQGEYGPKARIALNWLKAFEEGLSDYAKFSALAVDRFSPAYDHSRFSKEYHAYNRFTAMALKGAIAWLLGPENLDELSIVFISDAKFRMRRPEEGWIDNFEEYIPYRAQLDSYLNRLEGKKYPIVKIERLEIEDSSKNILLQFCDVLLGATQMAIVARSTKETKIKLGKMIVKWHKDLFLLPMGTNF